MIVEENRHLNDCETERALTYARADQTPPLPYDLPRHVLEPVSLDDVRPQFSTAPPVSVEWEFAHQSPLRGNRR